MGICFSKKDKENKNENEIEKPRKRRNSKKLLYNFSESQNEKETKSNNTEKEYEELNNIEKEYKESNNIVKIKQESNNIEKEKEESDDIEKENNIKKEKEESDDIIEDEKILPIDNLKDNYIIGIDLGTTNSCVGVYKNNRVDIIENTLGKRITPSYVCYKTNSKILVGEQAKDQIINNIKNTIYDTKRLIGRNFSDEIVQKDIKLWSFTVKGNEKDKPIIEVTINKEKKILYPEQVSSIILSTLKKDAEEFLGREVKEAVITVPAYFNNNQRQSTIDAGKIAGFNEIRTINEPTAAAIAYGLENICEHEKKIMVFDFGGGTLDITILKIKNKQFEVITSSGDSHLGGEDIDNELVNFCVKQFKVKEGIEISSKNQKALKRLKKECIEAKHILSIAKEASIYIKSLSEETDLDLKINRIEFNNICEEIFEKCIKHVENSINESKLKISDIEKIVLVGGSSKIPKIQEILGNIFGKEKLCKTINPDEAIAQGAAIYGNQFNTNEINNFEELMIKDIVPHSLGVKIKGNLLDKIIYKNTKIPCKIEKQYESADDYQDKIEICIYEGESKFVKECVLLDNFYISVTKRQKSYLNVIFQIDPQFSILKVTAKEIDGKNQKSVEITREKRDQAKIKEMIGIEVERKKLEKIKEEKKKN